MFLTPTELCAGVSSPLFPAQLSHLESQRCSSLFWVFASVCTCLNVYF